MTTSAFPPDHTALDAFMPDHALLESLMEGSFMRHQGHFNEVALVSYAIGVYVAARRQYGRELHAYLEPRLGEILGACFKTITTAPARDLSEVKARLEILKVIPTESETNCDLIGGLVWLTVEDLQKANVTTLEDLKRLT